MCGTWEGSLKARAFCWASVFPELCGDVTCWCRQLKGCCEGLKGLLWMGGGMLSDSGTMEVKILRF